MINVFECCTMYTENLVRTHNHAHSERTTHYHDTANACACAEQRIRGSKHRFLSSILKLSYAANSSSFHIISRIIQFLLLFYKWRIFPPEATVDTPADGHENGGWDTTTTNDVHAGRGEGSHGSFSISMRIRTP